MASQLFGFAGRAERLKAVTELVAYSPACDSDPRMQYSNHQVEAEWRSFFSRKQQSADTIFGATSLLYGAATTSRVFNNLPAGAATPHLTVGLLALAQWIVLIMLVGGLMRQ